MTTAAQDKIEIHELFSRYYYAVDMKDVKGWLSLWVEDGLFQNGDLIRAAGMEELTAFANKHINAPLKHSRHMVTNISTTINGDQAEAITYMLVMDSHVQDFQHATAICRSKLRKVNGEWKLTSHIYATDPSFDFSKLPH
jgi:ketosteroid isomerase-like protein